MSRHPNQNKGPAANAAHDKSTAARDLELLEKMQKGRALSRPHRHLYVSGVCSVCNQPEIDSTVSAAPAAEGEGAE